MGTSYEGVLVTAGIEQVRTALVQAEATAIVAPVGVDRTAILPREGAHKVSEVDDLGRYLSGTCGFSVLVHSLYDSDLLSLYVYRGGECVHEYQSEMAYLGTPFEDDDGEMKVELGGVLHDSEDASPPSGPGGADPEVIAPFGTGDVDFDRLGALLRGEGLDEDERIFAECRHWAVVEVLNLQPAALTKAYRHAKVSDLPGAVLVGPSRDEP
ncbi:hypothetical protein [Actinacidiphila paucisporea]|uniref:Uncharacterized protein n=1 Tax=Actinacidiphila paucisporea TaxID=310782 RepID=A0A1M6YQN8_9ACTN|nr:hypothetical protein [Actinacidiphila paucisporea]SHL20415.1 hypothetical protein SAMN05216499_10378 [Actinacidiphila paucisporea]